MPCSEMTVFHHSLEIQMFGDVTQIGICQCILLHLQPQQKNLLKNKLISRFVFSYNLSELSSKCDDHLIVIVHINNIHIYELIL